jgi:hypothetical protein
MQLLQQQQLQQQGPDSIPPRTLITFMQQLQELVTTRQQQNGSSGGGSDSYDSSKGEWGRLLGKGRRLEPQRWRELMQSVRRCLIANSVWQPSWNSQWSTVSVWQHTQACISTGLVLNSTTYGASRTRDGTHFLVYFEKGKGATVTVNAQAAQAKFFLRIQHPDDSSKMIRLVIADLCDQRPTLPDPDLSDLHLEGRRGVVQQASYPVLIESIEAFSNRQYMRCAACGTFCLSHTDFAHLAMFLVLQAMLMLLLVSVRHNQT